ncbi:hypothetical protein B0H10DRAFT_2353821, partial [Mycena sp. CBHHK59/15]
VVNPHEGVPITTHANPKRRANHVSTQDEKFRAWRRAVREERSDEVFLKGEKYRRWARERAENQTRENVVGVSSTPARGVFGVKFLQNEPITHESVFRGNQPARFLDAMGMVGIRTRSTYEGGDIITRAEKVGDNRDTPVKGVQTPAFDDKEDPFVNTLFVEDLVSDTLEDVHTFEELRRETPKHFAEYLTKLAVERGATREARAPTSVWGVEVDDYRTASDGFLQPEISLSDDPEIHTRLTDPKNPRRVAEIWKQMTVGKDLDAEQVKRVRGFVEEYADCFALSMREVVPIPGPSTRWTFLLTSSLTPKFVNDRGHQLRRSGATQSSTKCSTP